MNLIHDENIEADRVVVNKYAKQVAEYEKALEQIYIDSDRHIYAGCREFSARFPKRKMTLNAGNGSVSLYVEGKIQGQKVQWHFNPARPDRFGSNDHYREGRYFRRDLQFEPPQQFIEVDETACNLDLPSLNCSMTDKNFFGGRQR